MKRIGFVKGMLACCGLALFAAAASAQTSGRPIRIIVPLPAGTATDLSARVLGEQMAAALGQPVVIENKPGANGVIGVMDMVRSAPDGHTLLLGSQSPLATNVALVKNLSYDPRRDFTPISGFGETMHALMVRPDFPARTMEEFIAHARRNPGKVNVGTTTTTVNIQIASMNKLAGLKLTPIPYKGIPATVTDVIGGTLDASMVDLANALAHSKSGKLRAIAVTSLKRNPMVPDWPAISETLPGYDIPSWVGLVGPAGMPKETADRLNAAVQKALKHPQVQEKLTTIGMTPMTTTPAQFKSYIDAEVDKWVGLARDAGIEPQ